MNSDILAQEFFKKIKNPGCYLSRQFNVIKVESGSVDYSTVKSQIPSNAVWKDEIDIHTGEAFGTITF